MEPAGIIAPIEMSRSPEIIRRPTGRATMPRFAAKLTQLAAPKSTGRLTIAPASGRRMKTPKPMFIGCASLLSRRERQRHLAERVVGHDGYEQERADDDAADVRIEAGKEDALVHDGEGHRPDDDADDRA